jgi:hypothetical protein
MAETQPFPYQFRLAEPAVFVEMYLPKKISYQGELYDILEIGFDFDGIVDYFQTLTVLEKNRIKSLLTGYPELYQVLDSPDFNTRVERMKPVFCGYSMYEVDGVFFDSKVAKERRKNRDRRYKDLIAEERVQVVRFMLRPELEEFFDTVLNIKREEKPQEYHTLVMLCFELINLTHTDRMSRYEKGDERYKIAEYIDDWVIDTALFMFGFVMYRICEKMEKLYSDYTQPPQQEIWVTSLWYSPFAYF